MQISKSWLYQKYIIEKMSTPEISNICSWSCSSINRFLIKYNIPRRSFTEASILALNKVDKQYKSKNWLWQKYIKGKMSSRKIAKLVGWLSFTDCFISA